MQDMISAFDEIKSMFSAIKSEIDLSPLQRDKLLNIEARYLSEKDHSLSKQDQNSSELGKKVWPLQPLRS